MTLLRGQRIAISLLWLVLALQIMLTIFFVSHYVLTDNRADPFGYSSIFIDTAQYNAACTAAEARQPLYELQPWDDVATFQYSPLYLLLYCPPFYTLLSDKMAMIALFVVNLSSALAAVLWIWPRVFQKILTADAFVRLKRWRILAMVSTTIFANVFYGNIEAILLLATGLLMLALLERRPRLAAALTVFIFACKFTWLFPLILLLFVDRAFLRSLVLWTLGLLTALVAVMILMQGMETVAAAFRDWLLLLSRIGEYYPWSLEQYNGSINWWTFRWFGTDAAAGTWLAVAVKALFVVPLVAFALLARFYYGVRLANRPLVPVLLALAGYITVQAILIEWYYFTLGSTIFVLVLCIQDMPHLVRGIAGPFVLYLLLEPWWLLLVFGMALFIPLLWKSAQAMRNSTPSPIGEGVEG